MAQANPTTGTIRFSEKPVTIDHHGFDPITRNKAIEYIRNFRNLTTIDTSQSSFYITGDLLALLTTYLRNNVRFDGFRFTFGLDGLKKVVLILTREYGIQDNIDEQYFHVPERFSSFDPKCNTLDIFDYGRVLVNNNDGIAEGHLIDLDSKAYRKLINDFRAVFCQNAVIPNLSIATAKRLERNQASSLITLTPPKYAVVYSYFVGKAILKYLADKAQGKGVKIFLGYGPSRPNLPYNNMHLIAVGTTNKNLKVADIERNTELWGTYDTTAMYAMYMAVDNGIDGDGTPPVINDGGVPFDGSSTCIRPKPPYGSNEDDE